MEWKEHIAWFAPITLTAAAALVGRFGAMLNKYAPVHGGNEVVLLHAGVK